MPVRLWAGLFLALVIASAAQAAETVEVTALENGQPKKISREKVEKSEAEWKAILSPEQFGILRKHGTEARFSGEHGHAGDRGVYQCAACGNDLFSSETKFDSKTGWPSFWQPVAPENIGTDVDSRLFVRRTEVHCKVCGGHLGHVFEDGPPPTGLRYCINSAALKFKKAS